MRGAPTAADGAAAAAAAAATAAPPDGIGSQIEAELIRYVVRQAPIGFAIGIVALAAIVVVLWNAAPREPLLLWLLTIGVLTLPGRRPGSAIRARVGRRECDRLVAVVLTVAYGLAGVGWGVAAILLYPRVAPPYPDVSAVHPRGAGVSGIAALAPLRSAFVAYLTATFVPLVVLLLRADSAAITATGVLLVAFWVSTISLASGLRALLVRSLRLHFENVANLVTLTRTRDVLQGALSSTTRDVAVLADELAAANRARDEVPRDRVARAADAADADPHLGRVAPAPPDGRRQP